MNNNIICFLGVDGSGKSTLSKYLFEELKKRDFKVYYTWWLEGENSYIRRIIKRFGKNSNNTNHENNKNSNRNLKYSLIKKVYPTIVLLDYFIFGFKKLWIPFIINKQRVLIFDRFFYDVIFALCNEFNYSNYKTILIFNIFYYLLPKPKIIYFIKISPEICYKRKKQEIKSLEQAYDQNKKYACVFNYMKNIKSSKVIFIDNSKDFSDVKQYILKITLNNLNGSD